MHFGTIAIVGRSNVGKSTFLNAALGEPLAIVSRLPQTTRDVLLGVVHRPDAQLAFLDTPGLHRARSELGRRMNTSALDAARNADAVLMMTDVGQLTSPTKTGAKPPGVSDEDRALIEQLPEKVPCVLVINKVDLLRKKPKLLPLIDAFQKLHSFERVLPVSMKNESDVGRVLDALTELVAEGPPGFDSETLTDRPQSFFVREFIREAVLETFRGEVPHAVAVGIDQYEESEKIVRIMATVHVEKVGQRKILIGEGGQALREVGTRARQRIERLVGNKVFLKLFVRVTPRWKNMPRQLSELGYEDAGRSGGKP